MVRLKNRWFIVRVEPADEFSSNGDKKPTIPLVLPAKRDLFLLVQDVFMDNFGITHAGALRESKVQLCDNRSRLILVKTPRRIAAQMRAVLAWMTSLPMVKDDVQKIPVIFTVLGEQASLRTAKRSMIIKTPWGVPRTST